VADQQLAQFLRDASVTKGFRRQSLSTRQVTRYSGGDVVGGAPGRYRGSEQSVPDTALTFDNYIAVSTRPSWRSRALTGSRSESSRTCSSTRPQLEGQAKLILEGDFLPNTAGTAPPEHTYKGNGSAAHDCRAADKPNNWWLACTSKVIKPYLWQLREAPSFTYLVNPNDPNVFLTNQFMYGAHSSGAAAETVWWAQRSGDFGRLILS